MDRYDLPCGVSMKVIEKYYLNKCVNYASSKCNWQHKNEGFLTRFACKMEQRQQKRFHRAHLKVIVGTSDRFAVIG